MKFDECLDKMKGPFDKRPSIWRSGVLQVMITRACDQACFGCTQGSNLGGKPVMMTPDQAEQAFASLEGYFGVVGIFGGSPTLHPQFEEICNRLAKHIPWEQRGLWANSPHGKGKLCSKIFNPAVSNINVHLSQDAKAEFQTDWPEITQYIKGADTDSRHSPPFVAMKDLNIPEGEMWEMVSRCDVNQYWSALIGVFRGALRGWFCELAGAQSMLHADDVTYPDTGHPIIPGWWLRPLSAFAGQIKKHCPDCGIPLRGYGSFAVNGYREQVSKTHSQIYQPKKKDRRVELVTVREQLHEAGVPKVTEYIANASLPVVSAKREKRTAITVCWNYSDYLRHTLPVNRKFFDSYIVMTDKTDSKTIEIAEENACLVDFGDFREGFNKGKAINWAIGYVKEGWIVHLDADVIMPYPLEAFEMIFANLDPNNIYGCDRLSVPSFEMFEQGKKNIDSAGYVEIPHARIMERFAFEKLGGWVPIGFWQCWHSKHKRLYPEHINHAGDSDVIFAGQWPRSQRVLLPEASCLHLETFDRTGTANWFGRSTVPFGTSVQIG